MKNHILTFILAVITMVLQAQNRCPVTAISMETGKIAADSLDATSAEQTLFEKGFTGKFILVPQKGCIDSTGSPNGRIIEIM